MAALSQMGYNVPAGEPAQDMGGFSSGFSSAPPMMGVATGGRPVHMAGQCSTPHKAYTYAVPLGETVLQCPANRTLPVNQPKQLRTAPHIARSSSFPRLCCQANPLACLVQGWP